MACPPSLHVLDCQAPVCPEYMDGGSLACVAAFWHPWGSLLPAGSPQLLYGPLPNVTVPLPSCRACYLLMVTFHTIPL